MFFIGISAHLLIYLLVPALVIIYFYFKGVPGNSEVTSSLPPKVICVATINQASIEQAYLFHQEKKYQKQSDFQEQLWDAQFPTHGWGNYKISYSSPLILNNTLRAPPAFL